MIRITCPSCHALLRVQDSAAGRRLKCPGCAEVVAVPTSLPTAEDRPSSGRTRPKRTAGGARQRSKSPHGDGWDFKDANWEYGEDDESGHNEHRPEGSKASQRLGASDFVLVTGLENHAALFTNRGVYLLNVSKHPSTSLGGVIFGARWTLIGLLLWASGPIGIFLSGGGLPPEN